MDERSKGGGEQEEDSMEKILYKRWIDFGNKIMVEGERREGRGRRSMPTKKIKSYSIVF